MGSFAHDAPAARIRPENPAGTDGFGFVEGAHPEPQKLRSLFRTMDFTLVPKNRSKAITLHRQGDEGTGEGNFRALFVSIEEDQLCRGVTRGTKAA